MRHGLWFLAALQGCATLTGVDKDLFDDTYDSPDTDGPDTDTLDTRPDTDTLDTRPDSDTDVDTDPVVDTSTTWSHTLSIDGATSDWLPGERFATSAGAGTDTWISWDADAIYLAVRHPDVGAGGPQHWLVVTVGNGDEAARVGAELGTQQPALPFPATHVVRWKADDSYDDLLTWSGSAWESSASWLGTNGSAKAESNANQVVELRLPRAALGIGDDLLLHVNMVFEGAGFESSFAATPSSSFADGAYDPDYGAFFAFDLTGNAAPNTATPRATWTAPVDTGDTDTDDSALDTDDTAVDTDTGPQPWSRTPVIDGSPDWLNEEAFGTSSLNGTATFVTWDADNVYVAVNHPDVTGGPLTWVVVTLGDGAAGGTFGSQLGTQLPDMDFPATHILQWKADDSFDQLATWNGAGWSLTSNWLGTNGSAHQESNAAEFVEFQFPRAALGLTDDLLVHVNWVFEGAGFESSYGATPANSFAEGTYDPDYTQALRFDLTSPDAPAVQATVPVDTGDTDTALDTDTTFDTDTAFDTDTGETDTDTDDTDAVSAWSRAASVDGDVSDWLADETFPTSAGGTTATFVTWDATDVYVAVRHPDVATGGPLTWLVLTLGDAGNGGSVGSQLGTQLPDMAFPATRLLQWKADDSFDRFGTWNGAGWDLTPNWLGTNGSAKQESNANEVVEFRIPRAALGVTDTLLVHVNWVFEGAGFESSYGATPAGSFPEGAYDPDYSEALVFDLTSPDAPVVQALVAVDTDTGDEPFPDTDTDTADSDLPIDTDTAGTDLPVDTDTDTASTDLPVDTDTDTLVDTDTAGTDLPVDTDTDTLVDTDTDTLVDTDTDSPIPWSRTPVVDGDVAEWLVDETFPTSSGGATATFVTWDATDLYVAVRHPDVASGGAQTWLVVTLGDGSQGGTVGSQLGTQLPAMDFPATHVLQWKADDSFDQLGTWNGAGWDMTPNWLGTNGSARQESNADQVVEFRLPLAALDLSEDLLIHVNWVFEGAGFESSYGATPATSFAEGTYDPDYGEALRFDLTSPDAPVVQTLPPVDTALLPWRNTITVDGDPSDWLAGEAFQTSQGGDTLTRITWDDDALFVGVRHPDVSTGGPNHWVVVSLGDGGPGADRGALIGTQEPASDFPITHVLRWKADDSYDDLLSFNGLTFDVDDFWLGTQGSAKAESNANGFVEFRIPFAAIGIADRVLVHVNWVFEGSGTESSFACTPSSSFAQGVYDPDYTSWYDFDLMLPDEPNTIPPSP